VLCLAADHQVYLASERTFNRILNENEEQHHYRGVKAAPWQPLPTILIFARHRGYNLGRIEFVD